MAQDPTITAKSTCKCAPSQVKLMGASSDTDDGQTNRLSAVADHHSDHTHFSPLFDWQLHELSAHLQARYFSSDVTKDRASHYALRPRSWLDLAA